MKLQAEDAPLQFWTAPLLHFFFPFVGVLIYDMVYNPWLMQVFKISLVIPPDLLSSHLPLLFFKFQPRDVSTARIKRWRRSVTFSEAVFQ